MTRPYKEIGKNLSLVLVLGLGLGLRLGLALRSKYRVSISFICQSYLENVLKFVT